MTSSDVYMLLQTHDYTPGGGGGGTHYILGNG